MMDYMDSPGQSRKTDKRVILHYFIRRPSKGQNVRWINAELDKYEKV
jgi:hypothetical protein